MKTTSIKKMGIFWVTILAILMSATISLAQTEKPKINISKSGNGTIDPAGPTIERNNNSTVTFKITPAADSIISDVKWDDISVDITDNEDGSFSYISPTVVNNETYSFHVDFSSSTTTQYTITPTATPSSGGTISPSIAVTVNQGDNQTFTFSPTTDPLYYISDVKVDGASIPSTPTPTSYEFTSVDQNHTIEVVFASDDVNTYTVTASVNDENMGSIDPSENFTVNEGEDITFEITPYPGHIISDILINNTSTDQTVQSPFTISNVTENKEVQAVFAEDPRTFDITVDVNNDSYGSISPSETPLTVLINDTPSFTISPASKAYAIKLVKINGVQLEEPVSSYTFPPVTSDNTSIYAEFEEQTTYTITSTLTPTDAGSISPSTPYTAAENETPSFMISANTGYQIKSVTTSAGTTTVGATYYNLKLPAVTSDQTITVEFETATGGGDSGDDDTSSGCLPIDDVPVEVQTQGAPANIMFLIEDANTMDFEVSTLEDNMLFYDRAYLYGMPDDYTGGTSDDSDNTMAYGQNKTLYIGNGDNSDPTRLAWKAYWHEFNRMYYNPAITYQAWPTPSGTMSPADIDNPYTHPIDLEYQIDLDMIYGTAGSVTIPVSHYYVKGSDDNIYLIIIRKNTTYSYEYYRIDGADATTDLLEKKETHQTINNLTITPLTSFPSALTEHWDSAEKERQNFANWFTYHRKRYLTSIYAIAKTMKNITGVNIGFTATVPAQESSFTKPGGATPEEYLTLGTADFIQPVLSIDTHLNQLMWRLYEYRVGNTSSSSFIRRALEEIGKYYDVGTDTNFGDSPIKYTCQQNFTIVFNDGAYHGGAPNNGTDWDSSAPPSDTFTLDGETFSLYKSTTTVNGTTVTLTNAAPFVDTAGTSTKTMADMAMWFYIRDLAPDLKDEVPTMEMSASNSKTLTSGATVTTADVANWQHMVTYSVVFGDHGAHDPAAFDITADESTYPSWPKGISNASTDPEIVDDIWHAALNGRGLFFAASNPDELEKALQDLISDIKNRTGSSGASVSVSSNELVQGTNVFQSKYNTKGWAGDVYSYELGSDGSWTLGWQAGALLDSNTSRNIATFSGTAQIPFSGDLSSYDSTNRLTTSMVSYLRGDKTNEEQNGGSYRDRITSGDVSFTLGDIIHSSPVYHEKVIYAGANDGMLHAFRAEDSSTTATDAGQELFAYVPSFVHSTIADLSDPSYEHQYYVDSSPTIETISQTSGEGDTATTTHTDLLVGGLGRGGKGYYALDVTNPANNVQGATGTSSWVEWEFPSSQTSSTCSSTALTDFQCDYANNMGYSYSRAWIVRSESADHPWVVIFGNGYSSTNEEAILYVLDAFTGDIIKEIGTNVTGCNGLSTPIAVDVDDDQTMDYVYAGDLKGNLWKFDLSSTDTANWGVAFYSGTPKPLFKQDKPITTMPDVMKHCEEHGYMVFFGTGKLLSYDEDVVTSGHRVYGIWDFGDDDDDGEYLGELTTMTVSGDTIATTSNFNDLGLNVQLFKQTVTPLNNGTVRVIGIPGENPNWLLQDDDVSTLGDVFDASDNPNPGGSSTDLSSVGWFFELPDTNERVIIDVRVRAGVLYVVTTAPGTQEMCSQYSAKSWLLAVDACTGGILDELVWDYDDDGALDEGDYVTISVPDGDGGTTDMKVPVSGFQPDGNVVGITFTEENIIVSYETPPPGGEPPFDPLPVPPVSPSFLFWRQIE